MMNPKYLPTECPPGYIFFTNNDAFDFRTKENLTEERLKEIILKEYNFDDCIVLTNVAFAHKFSVFIPEKYSSWLETWRNSIINTIKFLKNLDT